jgi:molecular chaperone DnaK (HSP70)
VLTVGHDGVRVVATDGDSQLGGADWDDRITSFLLESFARSAKGVDPYEDDALVRRIGLQAEEAKRSLSTAMARTVTLRSGSESAAIVLDRSTVDTLGADLVDRTLDIVDRAIAAARARGVSRIGKVILVGGSTRMPAIAPAIAGRTGMAPKLIDPDLAVVYGAAIRAHQLADESSRTNLARGGGMLAAIADKPTSSVVPRSFGVLIEDSSDPAGERRIVVHTVHQNQALPACETTSFCTIVDGQQRVRIQVYEQAGDVPSEAVEHNRRVLDGELTGLPALAAGSRIEVTLRVSADGLLQVTAREPASGTTLDLEAYVDGVVDTARAGQLALAMTGLTVKQ